MNQIEPSKERKIDCSKNGDKLTVLQENQRKVERKLYPLRIDSRTVIYVTKDKCNADYRELYKTEKLNKNCCIGSF